MDSVSPASKNRTMELSFNAYIDGFNLYKGILQENPEIKWLDIKGMCEAVWPQKTLDKIYYFTAGVKSRYPGDRASDRPHAYLRALESSGVKIVKGKFVKNLGWAPLLNERRSHFTNPQLPRRFGFIQGAITSIFKEAHPKLPSAQIVKLEEKGSDVNLASYLLRDVFVANAQSILVISGDSDLVTPIKMAVNHGAYVKVIVPGYRQNTNDLQAAASELQRAEIDILRNHQFEDVMHAKSGKEIRRPRGWK